MCERVSLLWRDDRRPADQIQFLTNQSKSQEHTKSILQCFGGKIVVFISAGKFYQLFWRENSNVNFGGENS